MKYNYYATICGQRSRPMTCEAAITLVTAFRTTASAGQVLYKGERVTAATASVYEAPCRDMWFKFWKPVYCESPMDITSEDYKIILRVLRDND